MKHIISLLLSLVLLCTLVSFGTAEEGPVVTAPTATEISEEITRYLNTALSMTPSEVALDEENEHPDYAFSFDAGFMLYADEAELDENSTVHSVELLSSELTTLHGARTELFTYDLLALFPSANDNLTGSYYSALLYSEGDAENGFSCGTVSRSGQKITNIQYSVSEPVEDGFLFNTMSCLIDNHTISAILLTTDTVSAEEAAMLYDALHAGAGIDDYSAVPMNFSDGSDLEPFVEEDLVFSGFDFPNTASASLSGVLEEAWEADGEDGWLHRMDGNGWTAIFKADANQQNEKLTLLSIFSDELEGPRAIRVGDSITDTIARFCYLEMEFDYENMLQPLYGTTEGIPYGLASYSEDGTATLRYTLRTESGDTVLMFLDYGTDMLLKEITLTII